MQGLEQQDLEKMSINSLELLYKNCNFEINKLETDIAEKKISIEKLSTVKSIINKTIYLKQNKKDDYSTVQREKVTV